MPLPKITTPTYEVDLPSTGERVQFRPFLVREEKILLLALESEDIKQITTSIKTVLKNCILNKKIKVESLPTFDIEYLFLNIRGKSVDEELEVKIICPDDKVTEVTVNINIDDIKVIKEDSHSNKIKIDDSIMVQMKYPSLEEFIKNNFDINNDSNMMEQSFDLIASCIDKIYTEDEVWSSSDVSKKEIIEFLESMNSTQFKSIETFFETMPKLSHKIEVLNPKTNETSEVIIEGLASFFE